MMILSHGVPDLKVIAAPTGEPDMWAVACYAVGQHVHETVGALRLCAAQLLGPVSAGGAWRLKVAAPAMLNPSKWAGLRGPFDSASEAMHYVADAYRAGSIGCRWGEGDEDGEK